MGIQLRTALTQHLDQLRFVGTAKRVRAVLRTGGDDTDEVTIADTTRAALVWEPRRVVPSYAVPEADVTVALEPSTPPPVFDGPDGADAVQGLFVPDVSDRPVLDPSIPFDVHTAPGQPLDVAAGASALLPGAAFRLEDEQLDGYVVLDFDAFSWFEEDEPIAAHPRDPFHRVDILRSSRHVTIELDGQVLADSSRPSILFETNLPARFYLPREDVRAELTPTQTHTRCAYKGEASYWSVRVGDRVVPDVAWSYPDPLHEAEQVKDLICFYDEHVDVTLDGVRRDRPLTPWSGTRAPL